MHRADNCLLLLARWAAVGTSRLPTWLPQAGNGTNRLRAFSPHPCSFIDIPDLISLSDEEEEQLPPEASAQLLT